MGIEISLKEICNHLEHNGVKLLCSFDEIVIINYAKSGIMNKKFEKY